VDSAGTKLQFGQTRYRLSFGAEAKADDGMELQRQEQFVAYDLDRLPSDEQVLAALAGVVRDLERCARPRWPSLTAGRRS